MWIRRRQNPRPEPLGRPCLVIGGELRDAMHAGDIPRARALASELVASEPTELLAHTLAYCFYCKQEEWEAAALEAAVMLGLAPEQIIGYSYLAEALRHLGRLESARAITENGWKAHCRRMGRKHSGPKQREEFFRVQDHWEAAFREGNFTAVLRPDGDPEDRR